MPVSVVGRNRYASFSAASPTQRAVPPLPRSRSLSLPCVPSLLCDGCQLPITAEPEADGCESLSATVVSMAGKACGPLSAAPGEGGVSDLCKDCADERQAMAARLRRRGADQLCKEVGSRRISVALTSPPPSPSGIDRVAMATQRMLIAQAPAHSGRGASLCTTGTSSVCSTPTASGTSAGHSATGVLLSLAERRSRRVTLSPSRVSPEGSSPERGSPAADPTVPTGTPAPDGPPRGSVSFRLSGGAGDSPRRRGIAAARAGGSPRRAPVVDTGTRSAFAADRGEVSPRKGRAAHFSDVGGVSPRQSLGGSSPRRSQHARLHEDTQQSGGSPRRSRDARLRDDTHEGRLRQSPGGSSPRRSQDARPPAGGGTHEDRSPEPRESTDGGDSNDLAAGPGPGPGPGVSPVSSSLSPRSQGSGFEASAAQPDRRRSVRTVAAAALLPGDSESDRRASRVSLRTRGAATSLPHEAIVIDDDSCVSSVQPPTSPRQGSMSSGRPPLARPPRGGPRSEGKRSSTSAEGSLRADDRRQSVRGDAAGAPIPDADTVSGSDAPESADGNDGDRRQSVRAQAADAALPHDGASTDRGPDDPPVVAVDLLVAPQEMDCCAVSPANSRRRFDARVSQPPDVSPLSDAQCSPSPVRLMPHPHQLRQPRQQHPKGPFMRDSALTCKLLNSSPYPEGVIAETGGRYLSPQLRARPKGEAWAPPPSWLPPGSIPSSRWQRQPSPRQSSPQRPNLSLQLPPPPGVRSSRSRSRSRSKQPAASPQQPDRERSVQAPPARILSPVPAEREPQVSADAKMSRMAATSPPRASPADRPPWRLSASDRALSRQPPSPRDRAPSPLRRSAAERWRARQCADSLRQSLSGASLFSCSQLTEGSDKIGMLRNFLPRFVSASAAEQASYELRAVHEIFCPHLEAAFAAEAEKQVETKRELLVFHGTHWSLLDSILSKGLLPAGHPGNATPSCAGQPEDGDARDCVSVTGRVCVAAAHAAADGESVQQWLQRRDSNALALHPTHPMTVHVLMLRLLPDSNPGCVPPPPPPPPPPR
eukprot:TRINITY_DN7450_c0_g2_i4.p1 TRINITY_DN7450_c0_g2~~TRINITY_DN7450_c0_g2_i4.p1  ORF type:complete len:1047 (+),score=262.72 TRINITY_DN7450_c0_g2_i4:48-3188(+)